MLFSTTETQIVCEPNFGVEDVLIHAALASKLENQVRLESEVNGHAEGIHQKKGVCPTPTAVCCRSRLTRQ